MSHCRSQKIVLAIRNNAPPLTTGSQQVTTTCPETRIIATPIVVGTTSTLPQVSTDPDVTFTPLTTVPPTMRIQFNSRFDAFLPVITLTPVANDTTNTAVVNLLSTTGIPGFDFTYSPNVTTVNMVATLVPGFCFENR